MKTYLAGKMKRAVSMLLCMALLLSTVTGSQVMAKAESSESATTVYAADGYIITHQIITAWEGGYNADTTITNTGNKKIENWKINLIPAEGSAIISIWNAEKKEIQTEAGGAAYQISNAGWNQDIDAGGSVTFGYQAVCKSAQAPQEIYLTGQAGTAEKSDYQIVYRTTDAWEGGCIVEAAIQNLTDKDMEDWKISFTWEGITITKVWNAVMAEGENGSYTIENDTYNSTIPAGKSVTFSMAAETDAKEITFPENAVLTHHGNGGGGDILPENTEKPEEATQPAITTAPSATTEPAVTATPAATEAPGEFEITEEMRRWNRIMMHMDAENVQKAVENVQEPVKTAILDSGVDEMPEIAIAGRKNLIPGEDDMTELYEDATGHGTAVASLMVYNKEEKGQEENRENNYIYEDNAEENSINLGEFVRENQADMTGINPNMELYSVRILDEENQAPVSRVIEGIEWAVENDIKILNISFGTQKDNEKLHKAIKEAYDAGMLIIAAAGNNGEIQYPAAYEEVIAAGSVDYTGNAATQDTEKEESGIATKSALSIIELAAPGEGVLTAGPFGVEMQAAGTSMAAGEISAAAGILWQQDTSVSSRFIRELLRAGANKTNEKTGYGIIDCEYSLAIYDDFKEAYEESATAENNITENDAMDREELSEFMEEAGIEENMQELDTVEGIMDEEETIADEDTVSANWGGKDHLNLVTEHAQHITGNYLQVLKIGSRLQDGVAANINDKKKFPTWHGYYKTKKKDENGNNDANYVAGYLYLSALAKKINENATDDQEAYQLEDSGKWNSVKFTHKENAAGMEGIINKAGVNVNGKVLEKNKNVKKRYEPTWQNILRSKLYKKGVGAKNTELDSNGFEASQSNKGLVVYGMALHTMTDSFAHSTDGCTNIKKRWVWCSMAEINKNEDIGVKNGKANDAKKIRKQRYIAAEQAVWNSLSHIELCMDENQEEYTLKIRKTKAKDFTSHNYFYQEQIENGIIEKAETDILNIDNYINPLKPQVMTQYLEKGFGVRRVKKYAKACKASKGVKEYLKRINLSTLKKKTKIYNIVVLPAEILQSIIEKQGTYAQSEDSLTVSVINKNGTETLLAEITGKDMEEAILPLENDLSDGKSYRIVCVHAGTKTTYRINSETPLAEEKLEKGEFALLNRWELTEEKIPVEMEGGIVQAGEFGGRGSALIGTHVTIRDKEEQTVVREFTTSGKEYSIWKNFYAGDYIIIYEKEGYKTLKEELHLTGAQTYYWNPTIRMVPETDTENGMAAGSILDSITGTGVANLTLEVREGIGITQGKVLKILQTDEDGSYTIDDLSGGNYCIKITDNDESRKSSGQSYDDNSMNILIRSGKLIASQNGTAVRGIGKDQMQIVLTWEGNPPNLDARMKMYINSSYYYPLTPENKSIYAGGELWAEINTEKSDGYGPETVTVHNIQSKNFFYYVHQNSGIPYNQAGEYYAKVEIYMAGKEKEVFYLPDSECSHGYYWGVFFYHGATGQIDTYNEVSYYEWQ